MHWTYRRGITKAGLPPRTLEGPNGPVTLPARPPRRPKDLYTSELSADGWDDFSAELAGFWLKVCEVWPVHLTSPDLDAHWNRILCCIDTLCGKVSAWPIQGDNVNVPPEFDRQLIVGVNARFVTRLCDAMPDPDEQYDAWTAANRRHDEQFERALRRSVRTEGVQSSLRQLDAWHSFELCLTNYGIASAPRRFCAGDGTS